MCKVGDLVPCSILAGEIVTGEVAGLSNKYILRGVGLVPMKEIRSADELTEFCHDDDCEWAAEILSD